MNRRSALANYELALRHIYDRNKKSRTVKSGLTMLCKRGRLLLTQRNERRYAVRSA